MNMKDALDAYMDHKENLESLDPVQHKHVLVEYLKYQFQDQELVEFMKDHGYWERWKNERDKMGPDFDFLVDVGAYLCEEWDWDEYREFYVDRKIDTFKRNNGDITSYSDELKEIRAKQQKNQAKINKIEKQVQAIYNAVV